MSTNERVPPVTEIELLRAAACDWRLSRGDVGVLAVILQHCNVELRAFPGPKLLAKLARLSVTSVKTSVRALEKFKYIEVERPGLRKRNRFKVLQSPHVANRAMVAAAKELGTPMAKARNWSRPLTQRSRVSGAPTGQADLPSTGQAQRSQLGKSARHEVALKALPKAQQLLSSTEEEPERSAGKDQAHPAEAQFLADYYSGQMGKRR